MIKHSSSSISVAVSAASHTLSDLKLMRLCVGVAECATEQTLHHLQHFLPFLFIHFTCDAPAMASCSLQSGVRRARSSGQRGVPARGAAGTSPFDSRNRSKRPVNGSSERPFAVSLTSPAGLKIRNGEFSRTVHRNTEDFVSTLGSSNKTKVRFVLTVICWFSLGKAGMG